MSFTITALQSEGPFQGSSDKCSGGVEVYVSNRGMLTNRCPVHNGPFISYLGSMISVA